MLTVYLVLMSLSACASMPKPNSAAAPERKTRTALERLADNILADNIKEDAERGDADAQYRLGNMYYQGLGVEQNFKQAFYWYSKAAEHGHKGAKFTLFMHYLMTDEPETSEDEPADAKEGAAAPSKEEKADTALLIIDKAGTLTGVTDKTKLNGKIVLPAEVKKIGKEAFRGCKGLTSMDFSACTNLTEIGERAFWNILPKVQFTAPMEAIKELLKDSKSGIKDEQITVKTGK